jgi:hypothetical protein
MAAYNNIEDFNNSDIDNESIIDDTDELITTTNPMNTDDKKLPLSVQKQINDIKKKLSILSASLKKSFSEIEKDIDMFNTNYNTTTTTRKIKAGKTLEDKPIINIYRSCIQEKYHSLFISKTTTSMEQSKLRNIIKSYFDKDDLLKLNTAYNDIAITEAEYNIHSLAISEYNEYIKEVKEGITTYSKDVVEKLTSNCIKISDIDTLINRMYITIDKCSTRTRKHNIEKIMNVKEMVNENDVNVTLQKLEENRLISYSNPSQEKNTYNITPGFLELLDQIPKMKQYNFRERQMKDFPTLTSLKKLLRSIHVSTEVLYHTVIDTHNAKHVLNTLNLPVIESNDKQYFKLKTLKSQMDVFKTNNSNPTNHTEKLIGSDIGYNLSQLTTHIPEEVFLDE